MEPQLVSRSPTPFLQCYHFQYKRPYFIIAYILQALIVKAIMLCKELEIAVLPRETNALSDLPIQCTY